MGVGVSLHWGGGLAAVEEGRDRQGKGALIREGGLFEIIAKGAGTY